MTPTRMEAIRTYRRLLQNPYACIEDLEELSSVHAARKVSEDPYAHIETLAEYYGSDSDESVLRKAEVLAPPAKPLSTLYTEFEVERFARNLQRSMWKDRAKLFPDSSGTSPFTVLNPIAALQYLGFEVELLDSLGQYRDSRGSFDVAGSINRNDNTVKIASQLPHTFRNFTAAHELGHAVMHENIEMHRDRPVDGSALAKAIEEVQADKFAVYFLMPRKLVIVEFQCVFGVSPFQLDEARSFALFGSQPPRIRSRRELSRKLASTTRFNGQSFNCLAEIFGVSFEAMAIRLEELGLVAPSPV